MGPPGSGKSTFYREYLSGSHWRINNDTIKNQAKAEKLCREYLKDGKSVVIDNLNQTEKARGIYIAIAKEAGIKTIKCLYFQAAKDQCLANNDLRKTFNEGKAPAAGDYPHMSKNISKVVIHSFFKNHEKPTESEGFTSVVPVPFIAQTTPDLKLLKEKQKLVNEKSGK